MHSIDGIHRENVEWVKPAAGCGSGVGVLAGSSGARPVERATLLAAHGVEALALRWFGGPGQHARPFEIELELFTHAIDALAAVVDRVSILGASFGAEAALSVAARHVGVASVVAIAPTTHVWPGQNDAGTATSHWTWKGAPLPFVPMTQSWIADTDPPAFRRWYELSLDAASDSTPARIPVEDISGAVVLVAGGDDQVWPSDRWSGEIRERRADMGRATTVLTQPDAGHRPILPGEGAPDGGQRMSRGGNPAADARLGADAWPHIIDALQARSTGRPGQS